MVAYDLLHVIGHTLQDAEERARKINVTYAYRKVALLG